MQKSGRQVQSKILQWDFELKFYLAYFCMSFRFVEKKTTNGPIFLFLVSVENIYCSTQLRFGLFVAVQSCKTRCLVLEISLQQEIPRYLYMFLTFTQKKKKQIPNISLLMNLPASPVKHHDVQIRRLATFAHVKTLQRDFTQLYKIGKKQFKRTLPNPKIKFGLRKLIYRYYEVLAFFDKLLFSVNIWTAVVHTNGIAIALLILFQRTMFNSQYGNALSVEKKP